MSKTVAIMMVFVFVVAIFVGGVVAYWFQVSAADYTELTILTYNTHLFENSPIECIVKCAQAKHLVAKIFGDTMDIKWQDYAIEEKDRKWWIAANVRSSGADIVALEEVWSLGYREWLKKTLKDTYPHSYYWDGSCDCKKALKGINSALPTCIWFWALRHLQPKDAGNKFHTQGNGLILLSKWPLADIQFTKFPAFNCNLENPETECWADKGVLTATVIVNGAPIRVGISHALTGPDDYKSNWESNYVTDAITPFLLNGETYIFALQKDNQAHIVRMEDYGRACDVNNLNCKYGGGWKVVYKGLWGEDYVAVTSFELNGHPYLFGFDKSGQGHIFRINDDPRYGWSEMYEGAWCHNCDAITSFELQGRPYIFTCSNTNDTGHIFQMNDDPRSGWSEIYEGAWCHNCDVITSFELQGRPYIFTCGNRNDTGHIFQINDDPYSGWTEMYEGAWPSKYAAITSFKLDKIPYIFAHSNASDSTRTFRINNDPRTGWSCVNDGKWISRCSSTFKSFEMNGHPYLFAMVNCPQENIGPCGLPLPDEAILMRFNDDPNTGWDSLLQLEDMKIIRDATIRKGDPPAIMMGDFNIHRGKYPIMDRIFAKAGAVDAYAQVADTTQDGNTIDIRSNGLAQYFRIQAGKWDEKDPDLIDRIDYVYVKQSGVGSKLVPTEAYVNRGWTYRKDKMALSDHYPLFVKFRLEKGIAPPAPNETAPPAPVEESGPE